MPKKSYFTKDQKGEIIDMFVDAFHEVVIPALETLATKKDLDGVKKDLDGVKTQLNRLDDRMERIDRKIINVTDYQAGRLDNHEKRLKKLEVKAVTN